MKYSIEYAHIYIDDEFGREQKKSIEILKEEEKALKSKGNEVERWVMVDNYSPEDALLNINSYREELSNCSATPDYLVREGDLVDQAIDLVDQTDYRINREYSRYLKRTGRVPCSLFIATFYLVRLGKLKYKGKYHKNDRLLNIISEKFKYVEKKGILIIKNSPYSEEVKKITNIYY